MERVLFVLDTLRLGGAEIRESLFAKKLRENGWEVHWASTGGYLQRELNEAGCYVHLVRKETFEKFDKAPYLWELIQWFKEIIKDKKITFASIHPWRFAVPSAIACIETGVPYAITLHLPFPFFEEWMENVKSRYYYDIFVDIVLHGASKIIAVSEETKNYLTKSLFVPEEKILILPNPVDEKEFSPTPLLENEWKFLLISRIDPDKEDAVKNALHFFLSVKKKIPQASLTVAGGSFSKEYFLSQIEKWKNEIGEVFSSIHFLGERRDIPSLIKNCSVVLGMDRVMVEAIFCKRPAVLINQEGCKGLVKTENLELLRKANFSGRGLKECTHEEVIEDLMTVHSTFLDELYNLTFPIHNSTTLTEKLVSVVIEKKNVSPLLTATTCLTEAVKEIYKKHEEQEKVKEERIYLEMENKKLKIVHEEIQQEKKHLEKEKKDLEKEKKDLEMENTQLKEKIQELQNQNIYLKSEIEDIKGSAGWTLLTFVYKFLYTLFPPSSKRNAILQKFSGVFRKDRSREKTYKRYLQELKTILKNTRDAKGVIIYPPTLDWNFMFQRPQQLARAFARKGFLFFFCSPNSRVDQIEGFQKIESHLYLCNVPWTLFKIIPSPVLYLSWAVHSKLTEDLNNPVVVYDCVDDLEVGGVSQEEHIKVLEKADLVLATAQKIYEEIKPIRPDVLFCPNAVDYETFVKARKKDGAIPPSDLLPLIKNKKFVVGYHGALAKWFDYDLLAEVTTLLPEAVFILIGCNYDGTLNESKILEKPNVYWLGMKQYQDLVEYVRWFDIGIIPFKINNITEACSPIKLWEYLASGKPVVTTDLPMCRNVEGVFVAKNPEEFCRLIEESASLAKDENFLHRIDIRVKQETWEARSDLIISHLEKILNQKSKKNKKH